MWSSIFSWWFVVELLGLVALPLTAFLFRRLPLRGYAFSKALGLLLVGYLSWLLAMLDLLPFGGASALLAMLLVGLAGWWTSLRGQPRAALLARLRARWRPILAYELLFAVVLYAALWLRWHFEWGGVSVASTEKPMDLAFLSGILNSPSFPPQDPWLAGYPINYYYLGYVMIAALKLLSGVSAGEALTLGVATSFAMAALMIAGLVVTLATLHRRDEPAGEARTSRRNWAGIAAAALLAVTLAFVAGNQYGLLQRWFGTSDIIGQQEPVLLSAIQQRLAGQREIPIERPISREEFGSTLLLRPDPQLVEHFDWWAPTRALWDMTAEMKEVDVRLASGSPETVPMTIPKAVYSITEIPFFSLFLGDMHPHVLAMPYELLALALALALLRRASAPLFLSHRRGQLELALSGLIIGSLYAINSWSAPTYALIYAGALALLYRRLALQAAPAIADMGLSLPPTPSPTRAEAEAGFPTGPEEDPAALAAPEGAAPPPQLSGFTRRHYLQTLASVGLAALVLLLPFLLSFKSLIGNQEVPEPWASNPIYSTVGKYIVPVLDHAELSEIVIIFGLFFAILLPFALLRERGLGRGAGATLGIVARPIARTGGWAPSGWLLVGLTLLAGSLFEFPLLALLPLAITLGVQAWHSAERPVRAFALWLFAATAFVLFMTDLVFIRDHFGTRMNTVFKFYYQIWIMWAMLGGYAVWALLRQARRRPLVTALSLTPAALLLLGALVYPYATLRYSIPDDPRPEIDALAFLGESDEAAAIAWVEANTRPTDIVLTNFGGGYDTPGRIAAATGRPTLLGWNYSHELLWRGGDPVALDAIKQREAEIPLIYGADTPESEVQSMLARHKVRYVVVGPEERNAYAGADRFMSYSFVTQVFSQDQYQIYKVH